MIQVQPECNPPNDSYLCAFLISYGGFEAVTSGGVSHGAWKDDHRNDANVLVAG
jgi:hypothetical protein